MEIDRIKLHLKEGSGVTVIFDGSCRVDEVLAVLFRFATYDFEIKQELVHLGKYQSCENNEQIANALNKQLQKFNVKYGEISRGSISEPEGVLSFQKDRASANQTSMMQLQQLYHGSLDMHCFSHTVTHVGEHMIAKIAKSFKVIYLKLLFVNTQTTVSYILSFAIKNEGGSLCAHDLRS